MSNKPLPTDDLLVEELQKLKKIFQQLNGSRHQPRPGLPDLDHITETIVKFHLQRGPGANYLQSMKTALDLAMIEQLNHLEEDQMPEVSRFDTSRVIFNNTTFRKSDHDLQFETIQRQILRIYTDRLLKNAFFRTANTLGVAQPSVRSRDEIWFLHGASTPVILRPLATGEYRFMGEAYVHGVMFGEVGARCTTHRRISIV